MKRHPFDPVSFMLGALVTTIGAVFLFGPTGGDLGLAWVAPTVLVALGACLVIAAAMRMRAKPEEQQDN